MRWQRGPRQSTSRPSGILGHSPRTHAIALGGNIPALVRQLVDTYAKQEALATALNAAPATPQAVSIDWHTTERLARARLADWRKLLTRQVDQGRQLLKLLLQEPILFTPWESSNRRGYRFEGVASIAGLLQGSVEVMSFLREG